MAGASRTLTHLRELAAAAEPDAALLRRFAEHGDAGAFAELVRRLGPLALGVCRRVLGNAADADDACQAALLVLARNGGAVRRGESVAGYLLGVARFAALRARDKARRRRAHEARAARPEATEPPADPGCRAAIDEELARLPPRLRGPVVACLVRERTQEDAAAELGCSLSTLRRRLERGRELLRARLAARGVTPALGGLAVALSPGFADAAAVAAVGFVRGEAPAAPAAALANEVLSMMLRTKIKTAVAGVLVLAALVGGGTAWRLSAAGLGQPAPKSADPQPKDAKPKSADPAQGEKSAAEDRIKPGDRLVVRGYGEFPNLPLTGTYEVEPSGKVALPPAYGGRVKLDGLTLEEAEAVARKQIRQFLKDGEVQIVRLPLLGVPGREDAGLEARVRALEAEVKELRKEIDTLRSKKAEPKGIGR